MGTIIQTILESGMHGLRIEIECQITNGLPAMIIVGLAGSSISESKERVRNAILSSQLKFPRKRITINLAPGDIPKNGAGLDLAIAVAILESSQQLPTGSTNGYVFVGELGLDGSLRPVRGLIGSILSVKDHSRVTFVVPKASEDQLQYIAGRKILVPSSLKEVIDHLNGDKPLKNLRTSRKASVANQDTPSLNDVVGQETAKRGLIIAAAGGHNILLSGPPGSGKTMLSRAFAGLLPSMNTDEALEVTHIHSLVTKDFNEMITTRPFRSPHHSASHVSLVGGGKDLRPGEISLSHRGVLFLDELPEFNRTAIESLRQPLEDRTITITRASGQACFPANFILVATANPCPCGNLGSQNQACSCMPQQIIRYQQKLSGPLMDRIDLFVHVDSVSHDQLLSESLETSNNLSFSVIDGARQRQKERYKSHDKLNASLSLEDMKKHTQLDDEATLILNQAAEKLGLSSRGYLRTIKVARTIADLEQSNHIQPGHMAEALQYRHKPVANGLISA